MFGKNKWEKNRDELQKEMKRAKKEQTLKPAVLEAAKAAKQTAAWVEGDPDERVKELSLMIDYENYAVENYTPSMISGCSPKGQAAQSLDTIMAMLHYSCRDIYRIVYHKMRLEILQGTPVTNANAIADLKQRIDSDMRNIDGCLTSLESCIPMLASAQEEDKDCPRYDFFPMMEFTANTMIQYGIDCKMLDFFKKYGIVMN